MTDKEKEIAFLKTLTESERKGMIRQLSAIYRYLVHQIAVERASREQTEFRRGRIEAIKEIHDEILQKASNITDSLE